MPHEDSPPSQYIELAGTSESKVRVVIVDEVDLVLKQARGLRSAELTKLITKPRSLRCDDTASERVFSWPMPRFATTCGEWLVRMKKGTVTVGRKWL